MRTTKKTVITLDENDLLEVDHAALSIEIGEDLRVSYLREHGNVTIAFGDFELDIGPTPNGQQLSILPRGRGGRKLRGFNLEFEDLHSHEVRGVAIGMQEMILTDVDLR